MSPAATAAARPRAAAPIEYRNEVALTGRLAAPAIERVLPSGDVLLTFRVIVERPRAREDERKSVDSINCAAWRGDIRRMVGGWQEGDVVEVSGAIRRRWWRPGVEVTSVFEVEVTSGRRVARNRAA